MDMELYRPFEESAIKIIMEMSGIEVEYTGELMPEEQEISSLGVTSIIAFTGKKKGRFLIDLEPGLALAMASAIMGDQFGDIKDNMVLAAISEVNNIISGDAITYLNNQYSMSLRLAPPIVFAGRDVVISIPNIRSLSHQGTTQYGSLKMNIAWEGVK